MGLENIVNLGIFPIGNEAYRNECRDRLDRNGVLVMPEFLLPDAIEGVRREGLAHKDQAFF